MINYGGNSNLYLNIFKVNNFNRPVVIPVTTTAEYKDSQMLGQKLAQSDNNF